MTTTEILRIKTARDTIRAKLVALGLAESSEKIDSLATIVDDIPDNGAVSATVKEGETYSIPRGYHNGSGTVSGLSGGGNYNLQSKTVTPTKKQQSVTPDSGYFGLSDVTVNAIPSAYQDVSSVTATAADVLANKTFVTSSGAVTAGTMINNGTVNASIDGLTVTSYSIPAGYTSGGTVSLTNDIEQALAAI
ncbi:MAG: hypothetical protein IJB44_04925 [Clostridia bacterium]|nr:hypothetical protein [Clostridia bacterium]MBQ4628401.1 hypothetical protein [Clostridia bacterium]